MRAYPVRTSGGSSRAVATPPPLHHPTQEALMSVLGWFQRGVGEMMVARPDDAKSQVVWKHPDPPIYKPKEGDRYERYPWSR